MFNPLKHSQGQSMIEYTGALVLSALIVAALVSTVQQTSPGLFSTLFQNAEASFSTTAPE